MRELADTILATLIHNQGENISRPIENSGSSQKYGSPTSIISELEILDSFFEVAKSQNWVAVVELLRIQEEYNRIKAEIKKNTKRLLEPPGKKEIYWSRSPIAGDVDVRHQQERINGRQRKILDFLKEKGRAQVWQVKQVFPEVSKRTLRRDFESLVKQGIIERIGERNETFYKLKLT
jgi:predicted HTH transcriptional regulator